VQLTSGVESSQTATVLSGYGWWTDTGTDMSRGQSPDFCIWCSIHNRTRRSPVETCWLRCSSSLDLPITSRMLGVDLVGSRRIQPAHVGWPVGPDGSRRIEKDRLDDQTDDQGHPIDCRMARQTVLGVMSLSLALEACERACAQPRPTGDCCVQVESDTRLLVLAAGLLRTTRTAHVLLAYASATPQHLGPIVNVIRWTDPRLRQGRQRAAWPHRQ
jgi:hypothetical protein